jgi:hypothetical protein
MAADHAPAAPDEFPLGSAERMDLGVGRIAGGQGDRRASQIPLSSPRQIGDA